MRGVIDRRFLPVLLLPVSLESIYFFGGVMTSYGALCSFFMLGFLFYISFFNYASPSVTFYHFYKKIKRPLVVLLFLMIIAQLRGNDGGLDKNLVLCFLMFLGFSVYFKNLMTCSNPIRSLEFLYHGVVILLVVSFSLETLMGTGGSLFDVYHRMFLEKRVGDNFYEELFFISNSSNMIGPFVGMTLSYYLLRYFKGFRRIDICIVAFLFVVILPTGYRFFYVNLFLVLFLYIIDRYFRFSRLCLFVPLLIMPFFFLVLNYYKNDLMTFDYEFITLNYRVFIWLIAWIDFLNQNFLHILFGLGSKGVYELPGFKEYFLAGQWELFHSFVTTHNGYLQMLIDGGILVFSLFLYFINKTLKDLCQLFGFDDDRVIPVYYSFVYLVLSFSTEAICSYEYNLIMFFFLISMIVSVRFMEKDSLYAL